MRAPKPLLAATLVLAAGAAFATAGALTQMLAAAGIKDASLLSDDVNLKLSRLNSQAARAKTPDARARASAQLRQQIQSAARVYREFQVCRRAADANGQSASQTAACSNGKLAQMQGVINDNGLQQLKSDLGLIADNGGSCSQDDALACQLACDRDPTCTCCL